MNFDCCSQAVNLFLTSQHASLLLTFHVSSVLNRFLARSSLLIRTGWTPSLSYNSVVWRHVSRVKRLIFHNTSKSNTSTVAYIHGQSYWPASANSIRGLTGWRKFKLLPVTVVFNLAFFSFSSFKSSREQGPCSSQTLYRWERQPQFAAKTPV